VPGLSRIYLLPFLHLDEKYGGFEGLIITVLDDGSRYSRIGHFYSSDDAQKSFFDHLEEKHIILV
jgi:hypothetical protein